ncbi:MAG: ATP-dependent RNA helicase DbpA [Bradymonadia bacterium]
MVSQFTELSLRAELIIGTQRASFQKMTPIQAAALPTMLAGQDVLGQAATGTGKTAAFALSVLNQIDSSEAQIQALVLCPTRELADQVAKEFRMLAKRLENTRVLSVCGGRPLRQQVIDLKRGAQIIVGTPGRVLHHLKSKDMNADSISALVLDEADRMLDMGFSDDVNAIVDYVPSSRQTLLFSATFPEVVLALSQALQREPKHISVGAEEPSAIRVSQRLFWCEVKERFDVLVDLLAHHRPSSVLIFCETRDDCAEFAKNLQRRGADAEALHGNMEQRDRDNTLLKFSNGSLPILVATNVAARGIDVERLPMVIIAELSKDPQSHVHRIGRTGRAGEKGLAFSIVTPRERMRLERIEAYLDTEIPEGELPPRAGGGLGFLVAPNRTLLIHAGKRDKIRKGDVLGALIKDGGIPNDAIGKIELQPGFCTVAISRQYASKANQYLKSGRVKQKKVRARLL